MPMRTRYVESVDLFVEVLEGEIILEEAQAMKLEEIESGHFGPRTAILCIVHDVDFGKDRDMVRNFAGWLRTAYGEWSPRAAYLITGVQSAMLMGLLKAQFKDRPVELFSTLEAAIDFLGRDPLVCTADALAIEDVL